jgi:ParB/RepB/Spo0J family partition protein
MPEMIARERIRPNEWNANAFDPANYPKLVESIREKGIMEPLKVMPDPEREGDPSTGSGQGFLLVDGYHRWKAAGDLGLEEVPCEVWDISPEEAKVRGLQLNYLRGQPVPVRLANLVHDLNRTYSVDDLANMLPWSESQLRDSLELLKLPADLQGKLEEQARQDAAEAPVPVTVVLLGKEHDCFEAAMRQAKQQLGKGARRGECLAAICSHFVSGQARSEERAETEIDDD